MRAGFAHEYREPPIRSFSQSLPHYAKDRGLARLLRVEAMLHERKGRIARANTSDLDAVELGMRIRKGGTVIGALVGFACAAIGRQGLWDRLDRMSAEEARAVLLRLDRIEALRIPIAEALTEEKWSGVAGLLEIMRDPDWRWKLGDLTGTASTSQDRKWRNLLGYAAVLPYSKRAILDRYQRALDEQIRYAVAYPLMRKPSPEETMDPFTSVFVPVSCSLVFLNPAAARAHPELATALLSALEQVGDLAAVPFVRALASMSARSARLGAIRDAAELCLPALLQKAQMNTDHQTLLRPAEAPGPPDETLLRPAMPTPSSETRLLVRPAPDPNTGERSAGETPS